MKKDQKSSISMDLLTPANTVGTAEAGMIEPLSAEAALTQKIRIALREIPGVDADSITIVNSDGIVELYGSLRVGIIVDAVLSVAECVPGVKAVVNNLNLPGGYVPSIARPH
jgi:osmotically-inducible protein OsmY